MRQLSWRLILALMLGLVLSGCSSRQPKTAANQSAGANREIENTQAVPAVKLPPPTADDVRKVVARLFVGAVSTDAKGEPKFTVGDFNGDGSEDIAVLVHPNPAKLQEINNPQADWIIWNPAKVPLPKPHQRVLKMTSDLKDEHVRRSDLLLAVIHGQGAEGWRNPQAYQAFLLRNLMGKTPVAERFGGGLPFQAKPEDVLPETVKGIPGYVYWLGTVYAWQPKASLNYQVAASPARKAARASERPKS